MQLVGEFYDSTRAAARLGSTNFVMGDQTHKAWIRSLRNGVLDTAWVAHPTITSQHYLIVKEPNGAIGAPLLMEALPVSRMVLLVCDPRDVAASTLDATRRGSWMYEWQNRDATKRRVPAEENPNAFVKNRADKYLRHIGNTNRACDVHEGRKALIRYEDLRVNALGIVRRLCSALVIPATEKQLTRVVEKYAWGNVPEAEKGEGTFYRKAIPGGWREDLAPGQARTVEEITAPYSKSSILDPSALPAFFLSLRNAWPPRSFRSPP